MYDVRVKDKQLNVASFFGQAASLVFIGFFVERVASAYFGQTWGVALTIVMMLAVFAGVVYWSRRQDRKDANSDEQPSAEP